MWCRSWIGQTETAVKGAVASEGAAMGRGAVVEARAAREVAKARAAEARVGKEEEVGEEAVVGGWGRARGAGVVVGRGERAEQVVGGRMALAEVVFDSFALGRGCLRQHCLSPLQGSILRRTERHCQ